MNLRNLILGLGLLSLVMCGQPQQSSNVQSGQYSKEKDKEVGKEGAIAIWELGWWAGAHSVLELIASDSLSIMNLALQFERNYIEFENVLDSINEEYIKEKGLKDEFEL